MFKEIITPKKQTHTLRLPKKFLNKKLEVRIKPVYARQTKRKHAPLMNSEQISPSVQQWIGILPSGKTYDQLREDVLLSRL